MVFNIGIGRQLHGFMTVSITCNYQSKLFIVQLSDATIGTKDSVMCDLTSYHSFHLGMRHVMSL